MAMKMFNEWTPQNHGDFLAGFISALRFTDNTQPVIEEITLDPIGVGGKKGLGINVATVEGNNGDTVDINVYTRNVTADTAFGMFSVTLEWDSSRGYVAQLLNGTFGTFGDDVHSSISAGRLNVYGYKEDTSVKFEDNIILFTIRFVITDEVTKGEPIRLNHKNTSNYRMDIEDVLENYTSIGQWRESYGGMWGFLSPIDNTDGLIVSEKEKEKNNVDDGGNNVNANESPSMIAIGSGSTKQGQTGAVGIWTNANLKDNIQYNKFTCNLLINDPNSYLSLINIIGTDGWNLEYSIGSSGSNMLITLIGTRDTKVTGTVTVGSLVYVVNSDEYSIPLELGSCVLWNDDTQYNVINSDGLLFYSESSGGHGGNNFPPGGGGGGYGGSGGSGGMGGYGGIWSGTEQIIWVSVNNSPKVPVYLKPGDNDIWFYIPYIFPDEEVDEGSLKIESEDYIWIPAGFRIIKTPAEDAPPAGLFINFVDKIRSNEVFDMLLQHVEPPVDLDNIIDRINSADIFDAELRAVQKKFDLDNLIDTLNSADILEIIKRGVNKKANDLTELVNSGDLTPMFEFAQFVNISGTVDDESHGSITGLGRYEVGFEAVLQAIANDGWAADKWFIADTEIASGKICKLKPTTDLSVYLTFKEQLLNDFEIAVNYPGSLLRFTNDSTVPWIIDTSSYGGVKSNNHNHSSSSEISTVCNKSGTFEVYYKTSTESRYDKLNIYKNGTVVRTASGETNTSYTFAAEEGDIIRIQYVKDSSRSRGEDTVWIKNIRII